MQPFISPDFVENKNFKKSILTKILMFLGLKKWRAEKGKYYYHILDLRGTKASILNGQMAVVCLTDNYNTHDTENHVSGNYYRTLKKGRKVVDKLGVITIWKHLC